MLKAFANRPDSEHGQALVRLVIAAVLVTYLAGLASGSAAPDAVRLSALVLGAETLLGLALVIAIIVRPGVSHTRRVIGMIGDYATLAAMMTLKGELLAPLYVIILWVTIGNGLRYGTHYLFAAMAFAEACFLFVFASTPYWHVENPYLGWGLAVGLVAIPSYLVSLLRDLRRAGEEARRANAAKSRFLANMSHEFRSPLNGIIGMADVLANTRLSPEQREAAEVIQTSAQTLLLLVEDVLDISAIEAGKLKRQDVDFAPREAVRRVRTMLQPLAAAKDLQFTAEVADDVPPRLHGDAGHLGQILINLAHNAIKFTDAGSVRIDVRLRDRVDGRAALRFSVRDTGVGIPPEFREKIFGAFEQVDGGPTRRHGGTGLGTTIAKTLTELLGGRIDLEDNPGGGTHFWVDLDFPVAVEADVPPASAGDGKVIAFDDPFVRHRARVRPLRVLVADDQPANRLVLQRRLERAGHAVVFAEDGEQALERLEDEPIDAAIVDLHMPVLGGLDVIKQARVMQAGGARTPIVVLSADATVDAVRDAENAGAFAFLTKPVVASRLLETLAEVAGGAGDESTLARKPGIPPTLRTDVLEELAGMGLGRDFLAEFADQCLRDASRSLAEVERGAAGGRWESVREAAHALKGVAENLGAQALVERSSELMRSSDAVLAKEWRRTVGSLGTLLEATAVQVRREVARIGTDPAARGDTSRPPDHESG